MLQALLDRLRLTYEEDGYDVKDYALKLQERAAIKAELEEHMKQAQDIMDEIDVMDAADAHAEAVGENFGEGDTE
jgi:hypothetical protein